jgi:hypothetical protein
MAELSIPSFFEPPDQLKHHHTSKKAAVLGTILYLQDHNLSVRKREIFRHSNIPRQTGT